MMRGMVANYKMCALLRALSETSRCHDVDFSSKYHGMYMEVAKQLANRHQYMLSAIESITAHHSLKNDVNKNILFLMSYIEEDNEEQWTVQLTLRTICHSVHHI